MKKRYIVFFILLSIVIVGCSNSNKKEDTSVNNSYNIQYTGVDITPGIEFNADKINKEAKITEIPSCAFQGTDTVYTYDDIEITVADKDGKKIVYSVYFIGTDVKTTEGISIDATKDEIIKTYGNASDDNDIKYTKGDVELHFVLNNDRVTSIEYVLVTNK